jgi:NAD(P)H-hydrate epimerase
MQRAGAAAAAEIALRYRDRLVHGVLVLAGPGNNGGDAWVVARALAAIEPIAAKTPDAIAERALALAVLGDDDVASVVPEFLDGPEALVVDGLLGTGGSGAPRGDIARLIALTATLRAHETIVVALDVPSGLDASTGASHDVVVQADLTLSFGTIKRGHLVNRDVCGAIAVLDIGLGSHASLDDGAPLLVDEAWVDARLPSIPASAHKGVRKKVAIIGGAPGMAGATVLAARAAMRSGVGAGERAVRARHSMAGRRRRRRARYRQLGGRGDYRTGARSRRREPCDARPSLAMLAGSDAARR